MKFDVIRAVEACYAAQRDDRGWLDGLLESLSPLDDGSGAGAFHFLIGADGCPVIECEATTGAVRDMRAHVDRLLSATASADAILEFFGPNPPATYVLRRTSASLPALARSARSFFRRRGVRDALGICAAEPSSRTVLVVVAAGLGRPLLPPRTLHQLGRVSAHLNSSARLRRMLAEAGESGPDAVIDPAGKVLDAVRDARSRNARASLTDAVRRMDRARGALRRTDADEALQLWQGLVDGTWSLIDQCDSDGKRYVSSRAGTLPA